MIGLLPVPGAFICMMWLNVVVALSVSGMNIEYVNRHVSPLSRFTVRPNVRMPRTSWRCRSVEVSRSIVCMVNR